MSVYEKMTAIADAIREKTGKTDKLTLDQMKTQIGNLYPGEHSIGRYTFQNCTTITALDCPSLTTIGSSAFQGCTALTSVSVASLTTISHNVFQGCTALDSVNLPLVTSMGEFAFQGCALLRKVIMPSLEKIGYGAFQDCTTLKFIDGPIEYISSMAFYNCSLLSLLVLRSESICSIASGALDGTRFISPGGSVCVPADLIDSYKAAPVWSTLYAQGKVHFEALEDCTVDGTVTGALDESKFFVSV